MLQVDCIVGKNNVQRESQDLDGIHSYYPCMLNKHLTTWALVQSATSMRFRLMYIGLPELVTSAAQAAS